MEEKKIKNINELVGFEWEYKEKEFIIEKCAMSIQVMKKNHINEYGQIVVRGLFWISELNLQELEVLGLKVILDKKPTLTRKESYLLEAVEGDFYITRHKKTELLIHDQNTNKHLCFRKYITIDPSLFPFITWESQKAWSKGELLSLEGVD